MAALDTFLSRVAPGLALKREMSRHALDLLQARRQSMHYDAATTGRRAGSWHANRGDADAAAGFGRRERMSAVARDMIRNTPYAVSGQRVIVSNMVGDGIIPNFKTDDEGLKTDALKIIEEHLDTTKIDVAGNSNLYGLQSLAANSTIDAGEALVVAHFQPYRTDLKIPLQIEVLEPDHLDSLRDGGLQNGGYVQDGIQFDAEGRRVGYWLFSEHPGALGHRGGFISQQSQFVPADQVAHVFRVDRPGQNRGVTWFAPVALALQDLGDYHDAQLMRQKIAACFAGFRKLGEEPGVKDTRPFNPSISPGLIQDLGPGEEIHFSNPPSVGDFDPTTKAILRAVASGLGITYEALAGDLTGVNFSGGRMGRVEMNRNVSSWQWKMLIPQLCDAIGDWVQLAWMAAQPQDAMRIAQGQFAWTPPHKVIVDPAREVPAMLELVRGGGQSLQGLQRELGHDPERLRQEQREDREKAFDNGLYFSTDVKRVSDSGVTQARPAGSGFVEEDNDDE